MEQNKRKLRVLRIAHSSLTPALRERERAVARCFPNVDLQVVTTERWREAEVDVEALPDELFPVHAVRTYLSQHIQLFAYDPRPIISALREHRPHLIDMNHEPYSVACAELLTLFGRYAPKVPVVMQTAQNIFRRYPQPFHWLERRALRKVEAAYVCSEGVREVLLAKGFSKPVAVIPFGVDVDKFSPVMSTRPAGEASTKKAPTIGFVGRMLAGKGLNVLSDALRSMTDQEWNLLVVGDGPERGVFTEQLASAGLLSRVKFTGAVSYEETPAYFQQIDVLVIPTETTKRIREQFGRVIVEAMASGVPVIGSTCGAIPEVIGDAGLVVPEGDSRALALALTQLLFDRNLRVRLGRAGRTRVEENYTWDIVAQKTYELYLQVLGTRRESDLDPDFELAA